jgi:phosphoribosyl-dephospho-CoA transferase
MSVAEAFRRHDWAWVGKGTALPDLMDVRHHHEAGLPFVVCRRPASTGMDRLHLGLALPDKRRIGFGVEMSGVTKHRAPLSLGEVLNVAPHSWSLMLRHLAARFKEVGMEARVYGSTSWQAMTGATYIQEESDLDLLLAPATGDQLRLALEILASMNGSRPRLDGEVVLPDGRAAAWREAASHSTTLLVKTLSDVSLVPRTTWMSALPDPIHV